MRRKTIVKLFVGSLLGMFGGGVFGVVALALADANGAFVKEGPDVVGISTDPLGWVLIGAATIGAVAVLAGAIVQFVAWIGAVLNTASRPDKTWFVILLVTGLVSAGFLGFLGLLAYVVAGPDDPMTLEQMPWQAPAQREADVHVPESPAARDLGL